MLKITTRTRSPVQVVVRSRKEVRGSGSRSFTTLNIPGIGGGNNVYLLEDERATEYIDRLVKMGLITTEHVPNKIRKED